VLGGVKKSVPEKYVRGTKGRAWIAFRGFRKSFRPMCPWDFSWGGMLRKWRFHSGGGGEGRGGKRRKGEKERKQKKRRVCFFLIVALGHLDAV